MISTWLEKDELANTALKGEKYEKIIHWAKEVKANIDKFHMKSLQVNKDWMTQLASFNYEETEH